MSDIGLAILFYAELRYPFVMLLVGDAESRCSTMTLLLSQVKVAGTLTLLPQVKVAGTLTLPLPQVKVAGTLTLLPQVKVAGTLTLSSPR